MIRKQNPIPWQHPMEKKVLSLPWPTFMKMVSPDILLAEAHRPVGERKKGKTSSDSKSNGYEAIAEDWEITEDPVIADLLSPEDAAAYLLLFLTGASKSDDEGAPNPYFHSKENPGVQFN